MKLFVLHSTLYQGHLQLAPVLSSRIFPHRSIITSKSVQSEAHTYTACGTLQHPIYKYSPESATMADADCLPHSFIHSFIHSFSFLYRRVTLRWNTTLQTGELLPHSAALCSPHTSVFPSAKGNAFLRDFFVIPYEKNAFSVQAQNALSYLVKRYCSFCHQNR